MKRVIRYGKVVVPALIVIVVAFAFAGILFPARAATLDTYHSSWHLVRETATEDGATFAAVYDLAGGEGNYASKNTAKVLAGGAFRIVSFKHGYGPNEGFSAGGAWQYVISGGLADNDTFSFTIVGWSKLNGMLQVIAEGNGVIGTQDVVLSPDDGAVATDIWWADTITLDETTKWTSVGVTNSGDNEVAAINIDMTGLEWVQFVFYDADGSGTESSNITVFGRRF